MKNKRKRKKRVSENKNISSSSSHHKNKKTESVSHDEKLITDILSEIPEEQKENSESVHEEMISEILSVVPEDNSENKQISGSEYEEKVSEILSEVPEVQQEHEDIPEPVDEELVSEILYQTPEIKPESEINAETSDAAASEAVSTETPEKPESETVSSEISEEPESETVSSEISEEPESEIVSSETLEKPESETEPSEKSGSETERKAKERKILPAALVVTAFVIIIIVVIILQNKRSSTANEPEETELPLITSETAETDAAAETEVSEYVIIPAEINPSEYEQIIEAESYNELPESLSVSNSRAGYSGEGYLSGFSTDESQNLKFEFEVPVSQHYDISICFAGDEPVKNQVYMDGEPLFYFESVPESTGRFAIKTYYGVFIEKGKVEFSINQIDGKFDLDYIKVKNNQSIYAAKTDIQPSLVNEGASDQAKELMKYLADNFGKKIITGQYVSDSRDTEIEKIYEHTGKYPVIRFGDMKLYSGNLPESEKKKTPDEIEAAVKWAENGGVVGFVWHWYSPLNEPGIYSKDTEFNLEYAVTINDVAMMNDEDLEYYRSVGAITNECFNIVKDIDKVSSELKKLCDKDIPVLWRPLHEASGDWFWWGNAGPEPYKWLWSVMYKRMTEYHHLNNLIWVWSAQGSDYFVGNDSFDIAAVDLYDSNADNTSYYKQYQWLYSLTAGQKLIALSECGTLPDMELTFRDRAVWSYFGLWYGDYILDKNGELSEKYNTRKSFMIMYNSDRSVTLEKYRRRNEKEMPVTTAAAVTDVPVTEEAQDISDVTSEGTAAEETSFSEQSE